MKYLRISGSPVESRTGYCKLHKTMFTSLTLHHLVRCTVAHNENDTLQVETSKSVVLLHEGADFYILVTCIRPLVEAKSQYTKRSGLLGCDAVQ
jgi:hypothetical protein